jgi:hypothetical protein
MKENVCLFRMKCCMVPAYCLDNLAVRLIGPAWVIFVNGEIIKFSLLVVYKTDGVDRRRGRHSRDAELLDVPA